MKGKWRLLVGSTGIIVILAAAATYLLFFKPDKKTTKTETKPTTSVVSEAVAKQQHESFASYDQIVGAYNTKNFAKVITLVQSFEKSESASNFEKRQAYSLCLDAAIQVKDNATKESCYKKARELAQADPDERTKTELTKSLDALYKGEAVNTGASDGSGSQ
jgi:preprotein translocase subunit YajC